MTALPLGVAELRAEYAAGHRTPLGVVEAVLEALDACDDPAIWIERADPDALRAAAAALEPDGWHRLPLYGIPFAVKDNIDVAGWITTAGLPSAAYRATTDAPVAERLIAAGALLVGKANLDQLATGLVGLRSPYGAPTNPIDPRLVPGGSSSGSAVAVARGLVSFAVGTDTAGSGRVPAACCGIVGLKPAPGALPTAGVVPACPSIDCVSFFAGSVADAAAVAAVAGDPWPMATGAFTVAVPHRRDHQDLDPGSRRGLAEAIEQLRRAGHEIVETDMAPFFAVGDLLYEGALLAERTAAIDAFLRGRTDDLLPVIRQVLDGGRRYTGVEVFDALRRLDALRVETRRVWDGVDALVVPTVPAIPTVDAVRADPIGANLTLGRFTTFVNLLGLASVTVPSSADPTGLPGSVTVIGPPGREPVLAALAFSVSGEAAGEAGSAPGSIDLAVVGAHLRGQPLNGQLAERGAQLLARTTTAPEYRLYHLRGGPPARPALERVGRGGRAIEVEVWRLDPTAFGAVVAKVAPPLGIGTVELADGRPVKGFICEPHGLADARDITAHGGWRAYLASSVQ